MHARSIAVAVLLAAAPAVAGLTIATPAHAQSPDDETTKAARARFSEGVEFYDKGQYEKARAAFLQAYALRKHPAVLLNLAQSSLKSNHALEAVRYFQQYLRESTSITAAQRSDAEKGITEARAKLGTFIISAPGGTEISVDGNVVGTAPLADMVDVEPGSHSIRAKMSDGTTDSKTMGASAGEKVKVQFAAKAAETPPVAATPPSSTAPSTTPPASTAPSDTTTPPPENGAAGTVTADVDTNKPGLFSRPKTIVPVVIGGVLVVVGVVDAIVFAAAKQTALDNGKKVAADIQVHGGDSKTCTRSPVETRFVDACKSLQNNVNTANTNNTLANVGIGVAIGGAVLAVGWWLFAPKKEQSAAPPPSVSFGPLFGPGTGNGAAFKTTF